MLHIEKTLSPEGQFSYVVVDENMHIVEEIALYLHHLENKEFSPNTIEKYCRNLKTFFIWLSTERMHFSEVVPRNMMSFIAFLDEQNPKASPNTINNYLATVSSFYHFYEVIGGCVMENPVSKVKHNESNFLIKKLYKSQVETSFFKRKVPKSSINKRLFPPQINTLYEAIPSLNKDKKLVFRNQLLFQLLYESGIRIGEGLGLRLLDYSEPDPSEEFGELHVIKRTKLYHPDHQVKTNSRVIPVSMDLLFKIDEYVCDFRPQKDSIETIFVTHGKRDVGNFLSRSTINEFFKELSKFTGIHCTPHMLRHTHATELAEFGYDKIYISNRLGHNSIESTNKYVHPSIESQTMAYSRFMQTRKSDIYE